MLMTLRDLVAYRGLIHTLVLRDLKARYRGSALGLLWTLLNPLLHMAIYALVFSVYIRIDIERYPAFLFCGLLPWIWHASSLSMGATAIVDGGSLLKKVFFPPQVLPVVTVLANLFNFALAIPLLFVLLLVSGVKPGWVLLALPVVVAAQFAFTLGLTLIVSAVSVRYRDVPHIVGHLLTFWFFLSPILYEPRQVPASFRPLLTLNPITVFVRAYQDVFLHGIVPSAPAWAAMLIAGVLALWLGARVFERFRWSLIEEV